jgi:hypothetical protein
MGPCRLGVRTARIVLDGLTGTGGRSWVPISDPAVLIDGVSCSGAQPSGRSGQATPLMTTSTDDPLGLTCDPLERVVT